MKPRLKSSPAARALIKAHEPFVSSARLTSDGGWRVGYGHRAAAKSGVAVSQSEADLLLVYDVLQAEQAIDETIGKDLGTPQRDALVSFALGIGLPAFRRSAVVRLIRKDRWKDAADAIAAWNGGGVKRHEAERDLFLIDLPQDTERAPVELVIEFDHPADDGVPLVAANAEVDLPDEVPQPVEPDPVPRTAEPDQTSEDKAAPAMHPAVQVPRRSELAEKVILRMRTQLSGPVRETAYAASEDLPENPQSDDANDEDAATSASDSAKLTEKHGFVFLQSAAWDEELVGEATTDTEALPPIVGAAAVSADGVAGDVAGTGKLADAGDPETVEADDPLTPADIDADFTSGHQPANGTNGWTNGDATPAPGKNGGHLGEIILLAFGLLLIVGGAYDTITKLDEYLETRNLVWGPAALVLGIIFTFAVGLFLIGSKKK